MTPTPDDSLDGLLRGPATPLPDDGFTRRVMADLPPPRNSRAARRGLVCAAGALVGGGLALFHLAAAGDVSVPAPDWSAAAERFSDPRALPALVVAAVTVAIVFGLTRRRRPKSRFGV